MALMAATSAACNGLDLARGKLARMGNDADPWRRHHLLKRVSLVSLLLMFLVGAAVVSGQVDMRSHGFRVFVFGWMLFAILMLILTHEVRCPRCGQRFYAKGADFWQMTKTSLHCGQRKYAAVSTPPKPENEGR